MADDEDSSAASDGASPLTRPGFLAAAALVLVLVVLGTIVAINVARSDGSTTPPVASTNAEGRSSNPATPPPDDPSASVCGLPAGTDTGPLGAAPAVTWDYQGTIAFPKSPEFGPGEAASEGYRYCFQHSPAGAVVMAANAVAQGSDPTTGNDWARYALGEGRYRDRLVDEISKPVTGAPSTRLAVAGFRMLSYDEVSARVDLGVRASSQNQIITASTVYELVWQDGDWKISADVERPVDVATIPDFAGYTPWGA